MAAGASTATPPVLTPGSNNIANMEVWVDTVEDGTYQKQIFIPRCDEIKRPYAKAHIRKYARMAAVSLASTAVGTGLTYQDPKGTEVTLTPAGVYVATAFSANEDAQSDIPFDSDLANESERSLAEANDETVLANVSSLTEFRGNSVDDANAALIRNAAALLQENTNGMVVLGETTVYALLDSSQYGPAMSIPEFTSAQLRGDSENPNVSGRWIKGGGVTLAFSTVVTVDGNGANGVMWIPAAFAVGWNKRSQIKRQEIELQHRIILFNNFGSTVKHNLRAVALRTGSTIPV